MPFRNFVSRFVFLRRGVSPNYVVIPDAASRGSESLRSTFGLPDELESEDFIPTRGSAIKPLAILVREQRRSH